ncbi:MAG: YybH family protein [Candidatus Acidiferrales bacterium]
MVGRYPGGVLILCLGFTAATLGCRMEAPDTRAADEQDIRAADAACLKALQANDLDRAMSFYAGDATMFPIAAPVASGKQAIRTAWAHVLAIPNFRLTWRMTKIEVSRAGDLAYAQGTSEATFDDDKGQPVTEIGKWVVVWKKQADATWEIVADISNTDSPPPTHK